MESTSEGKERMDALSKRTLVLLLLLSSLCFFRVFFHFFRLFGVRVLRSFSSTNRWNDLATPTHTDNDTQCFKIRSQNLRFRIWNIRGKTRCDATKMRTVVASSAIAKQT